ncbi:hypothetical protein KSS87_007418, partial [Heliosperma pusillum]
MLKHRMIVDIVIGIIPSLKFLAFPTNLQIKRRIHDIGDRCAVSTRIHKLHSKLH